MVEFGTVVPGVNLVKICEEIWKSPKNKAWKYGYICNNIFQVFVIIVPKYIVLLNL